MAQKAKGKTVAYMNKAEAFQCLKTRNPRGADVGYKLFYLDADTQQRVDFKVEAEQVWQAGDVRRVMGLVWAGTCRACGDGFFQLSQTHPDDLNEYCSFCGSEKYEAFNVDDRNVFKPEKKSPAQSPSQSIGIKRRGRIESHILEVGSAIASNGVVDVHELIEKAVATMPAPEEGKRDTRRQMVIRAINNMNREKDGPLKASGGLVVFYV